MFTCGYRVKIHLNETQGELQSVLTEVKCVKVLIPTRHSHFLKIKASEKKRLHLEDTARDSESMFLVEMSELSTNLVSYNIMYVEYVTILELVLPYTPFPPCEDEVREGSV